MTHDVIDNYRPKKQRVRTAKGRTNSSNSWLQRHINDPYVHLAKKYNYASRSAFKLLEIDEKYKLIIKSNTIIDIGAAPGGWLQVISNRKKKNAQLIGIDLLKISLLIPDAILIQGNFLETEIQNQIQAVLNTKADLIVSDMASASSGDRNLDHLRNSELIDSVIEFANSVLNTNGSLILKSIRGQEESSILIACKKFFTHVKLFKPKARYKNSAEIYIICINKL